MLREPDDLEGAVRDAQGWLSKAQATTGREAETRVIARITLQEDEGNSPFGEDPQSVSDQGRADTPLMELRRHGQRTEYLHVNQPTRGIEKTAGEHDMPDDLPVVLGDQRETVLRCDGVPQGIDQVGHDKAMVAERLQVNIPHGLSVTRKFFAKIHARRVKAPPGGLHTLLEPEGHTASDCSVAHRDQHPNRTLSPTGRRFADAALVAAP